MTLQEWIRAERLAGRHWTQKKVADLLGVHKITLNKMLTGRQNASLPVMRAVADLTDGAVGLRDWPLRKKT